MEITIDAPESLVSIHQPCQMDPAGDPCSTESRPKCAFNAHWRSALRLAGDPVSWLLNSFLSLTLGLFMSYGGFFIFFIFFNFLFIFELFLDTSTLL
jgi:hypothetical protein